MRLKSPRRGFLKALAAAPIVPAAAGARGPDPLGAARPPATIPAGNLAGLPALARPMGFGHDGLPVSLQLIGRAFTEPVLVELGTAYQRMTDWHRRRPPLVS